MTVYLFFFQTVSILFIFKNEIFLNYYGTNTEYGVGVKIWNNQM